MINITPGPLGGRRRETREEILRPGEVWGQKGGGGWKICVGWNIGLDAGWMGWMGVESCGG